METRKMFVPIVVAFLLLFVAVPSPGQDLGEGITCQDLIDTAAGKVSRSVDGGKTYVPIRTPRPNHRHGAELLARDTLECQRLQKGEISLGQFTADRVERLNRLRDERRREVIDRANFDAQKRQLENQQRALGNQERGVQAQREGLELQRQDMEERTRQAEISREQQQIQHEERLQLERSRPAVPIDNHGALIMRCAGRAVDFVTGRCM